MDNKEYNQHQQNFRELYDEVMEMIAQEQDMMINGTGLEPIEWAPCEELQADYAWDDTWDFIARIPETKGR